MPGSRYRPNGPWKPRARPNGAYVIRSAESRPTVEGELMPVTTQEQRVAELYDALTARIGNCVLDPRDRLALIGGIEELIAVLREKEN